MFTVALAFGDVVLYHWELIRNYTWNAMQLKSENP